MAALRLNKTHFCAQYQDDKALKMSSSTFARFVIDKKTICKSDVVMEWGCGSGRDCAYLAPHCNKYIAVDIATPDMLKKSEQFNRENVEYRTDDFCSLSPESTKLNVIYSRFTLHSVTKKAASDALKWASANLVKGGLILIEARSVKDELYGKGKQDEEDEDAFVVSSGIDGGAHFRRFVDLQKLKKQLEAQHFLILHAEDKRGLSFVEKDGKIDDPSLVRVFAQRM